MTDQLSPHRADRIDLPEPWPLAALRSPARGGTDLDAIVLLLPGYTGSKEDFAPLIDPIAEAGFAVLAVDLPGQNESPGPDDEQDYRPDSLGTVVADLVGKLSADGRTVLLLGHSYGGLVARAAAMAGAPIGGLTLMGSGPEALPAGYRRAALDAGEQLLRMHGVPAAQQIREELDARSPEWIATSAELKLFLRDRMLRSTASGLLGMADGLRYEPDLTSVLAATLRQASTPCLVVCGEADDAWPVAAQRDMADRLDADFAVVPGARHSPNTENPVELLGTLLPTWRAWLAA